MLFRSEPIVLSQPMRIQSCDGQATIGPQTLLPYDLVAKAVDVNGLPLNPPWGNQILHPGTVNDPSLCCPPGSDPEDGCVAHYPCTHQYTYEDSTDFCGPHWNWFACTYTGKIRYATNEGYGSIANDGFAADFDYNLNLYPANVEGCTTDGQELPGGPHIHCEFCGLETVCNNDLPSIPPFDSLSCVGAFDTPWWNQFRAAVNLGNDKDPNSVPAQMINGQDAIMTGLMGLDAAHSGSGSELHPVWALAINVTNTVSDDAWVFFVRNWGNEGFCGSHQHYLVLPNNIYRVRLPWRPGATNFTISSQSWHSSHTQKPLPTVEKFPGDAVLVTFYLEAPTLAQPNQPFFGLSDNGSIWDGELHLRWSQ